jgi:hypothetical protein
LLVDILQDATEASFLQLGLQPGSSGAPHDQPTEP